MILTRAHLRPLLIAPLAAAVLVAPPAAPALNSPTVSPLASTPSRHAQAPALAPVHVLHIDLTGDLDTTRLARLTRERIDLAIAQHPARPDAPSTLIVLELSGDRWREDALAALAGLITDHDLDCRFVVWLCDRDDQQVGGGHAALALLTDAAFVEPRTHVSLSPEAELPPPARPSRSTGPSTPDDPSAPHAAPEPAHDLQSLLWSALQARRTDPLLSVLLPRPSQPLWYLQPDDAASIPVPGERPRRAWKLLSEPPPPADGQPAHTLTRVPSQLSPGDLLSLGVVRGQARTLPQLLTALNCRQLSIERATVTSPLPAARARVQRHTAAVGQTFRDLDASLYKLEREYGSEWAQRKRRAGRDALESLAQSARMLEDVRRTFDDNPELLDEPPDARAIEPAPRLTTWTALLDRLSADHAALDKRARRLAE